MIRLICKPDKCPANFKIYLFLERRVFVHEDIEAFPTLTMSGALNDKVFILTSH